MKKSDLFFEYPEDLVATVPSRPTRVLWSPSGQSPTEITVAELKSKFQPGDVLIINDTKVEPRRVVGTNKRGQPVEILFVQRVLDQEWQVLAPVRQFLGACVMLPQNISIEIIQTGRPQLVKLSQALDEKYFLSHGEMPLPPYIQKARAAATSDRRSLSEDKGWYQTAWAKNSGSSAAPTASLHFDSQDLEDLRAMGVLVKTITLHVGLGTYLPLTAEDLDQHEMHAEPAWIPAETLQALEGAKKSGRRVWALGTTAARALESWGQGLLAQDALGAHGETRLLIQEGYDWKVVDGLLTNFHQPESTLLAMVCGFAGRSRVFETYQYAIKNRFRLFSYGDLSAWVRE